MTISFEKKHVYFGLYNQLFKEVAMDPPRITRFEYNAEFVTQAAPAW